MSKVIIEHSNNKESYIIASNTLTSGWIPGQAFKLEAENTIALASSNDALFIAIDSVTDTTVAPTGSLLTVIQGAGSTFLVNHNEEVLTSSSVRVYESDVESANTNSNLYINSSYKWTTIATGSVVGKLYKIPSMYNDYTIGIMLHYMPEVIVIPPVIVPSITFTSSNSPCVYVTEAFQVDWAYEGIEDTAYIEINYLVDGVWSSAVVSNSIVDKTVGFDNLYGLGSHTFRIKVTDTDIVSENFQLETLYVTPYIELKTITTPKALNDNVTLTWIYANIENTDAIKVQKGTTPFNFTDITTWIPITDETVTYENTLTSGSYFIRLVTRDSETTSNRKDFITS